MYFLHPPLGYIFRYDTHTFFAQVVVYGVSSSSVWCIFNSWSLWTSGEKEDFSLRLNVCYWPTFVSLGLCSTFLPAHCWKNVQMSIKIWIWNVYLANFAAYSLNHMNDFEKILQFEWLNNIRKGFHFLMTIFISFRFLYFMQVPADFFPFRVWRGLGSLIGRYINKCKAQRKHSYQTDL